MVMHHNRDPQASSPKADSPVGKTSNLPHAVSEALWQAYVSHRRLVITIILSIALAELAAMLLIRRLPPLPDELETVLDAAIMIALIFPVLYFLSFRPLLDNLKERQHAEKAIRAERQRFNDILETLPGYLVLLTPDYQVPFANRFFRERFGESHGQRCYEYLFDRTEPCEICGTYKVLDTMAPGRWEWTGPDGHEYDVYDFPFTDTDGSTLILEMGIDVSERKRAEDDLRRVNRALSVLNACNQVLVRTDNEPELLQKMCEILVSTGEYRMAWVGIAEHDDARSVRPVAQVGFEDGYLESARISWADSERGHGPTGTAIRSGSTQVNQNFLTNPATEPWRESALLRGYQSSIALPLQIEGSMLGALTIYSAAAAAFDQEEVHLLEELADDLAFGIAALRVRAERNRAQEQVQAREKEWHNTFNAISEFVSVHDEDFKILRANEALANHFGKTPQELVGRHCYEVFHGSDRPWPNCPHAKAMVLKSAVTEEVHDPKIGCPLMVAVSPIMDHNNRAVAGVHIAKDISDLKRAEEALRKAHDELELRVQERTEELKIANAELEEEIGERKRIEEEIRRTTKDLQVANEGLRRFNKSMIGRELRMIELKKEINELCERFELPPRYSPGLDQENESGEPG